MRKKHGPYDVITDDLYDCRIPLHNELAYQHGIHFEAKVRLPFLAERALKGCVSSEKARGSGALDKKSQHHERTVPGGEDE